MAEYPPHGTVPWDIPLKAYLDDAFTRDISYADGVDPTGATECYAALQVAITEAEADGVRPSARGTFRTNGTIQIKGPCDFSQALINYEGSGTAVIVGEVDAGEYLFDVPGPIRLPRVENTAKSGTGWGSVAGTVGVQISNVYVGEVHFPYVGNFETGLKCYGIGQGVSYVTVYLGHLFNNKRNHWLGADTDGWCNQNTYLGGRMSHDSSEGTVVSGVVHVLVATSSSAVNGNNWYGTSLESPDVVQYHVDMAGVNNKFDGCRWENTVGAHRKIINRATASRNMLIGGFNANEVIQVDDGGSMFSVLADGSSFLQSIDGTPVLRLQNDGGSSLPSLVTTKAGETGDPSTEYGISLAAWLLKMKNPVNDYDAIILDGSWPSVKFGGGAAAPDVELQWNTAKVLEFVAGMMKFLASSTTHASLRIPHGTAPSSPVDGDMWTTSTGLFVRINGVTVGPLS